MPEVIRPIRLLGNNLSRATKNITATVPLSSPGLSGRMSLSYLPPLSLYIHFPWCISKCPYCDFNSHTMGAHSHENDESRYIEALIRDLEVSLPSVWGRPVISVFIGGGTPSLLSPSGLDHLLSAIRARIPLQAGAEITLEANPGASDIERFSAYHASGVNRLSLGIQSFNEQHLDKIGRAHNAEDAHAAVVAVKQVFESFNLDLMYALPTQSPKEHQDDLQQALSYHPPHLSYYQLTIEANTLFAHHPPVLPDEEEVGEMEQNLLLCTEKASYQHYEVSAYARATFQCQHNLNYWQFGDYLGIGAGAHGKISFPDKIIRTIKKRHPLDYMQGCEQNLAIEKESIVDAQSLPFEFMLNVARLSSGFPLSLFTERTGLPILKLNAGLERAVERGFVTWERNYIIPTALGRTFQNDLLQLFL